MLLICKCPRNFYLVDLTQSIVPLIKLLEHHHAAYFPYKHSSSYWNI